MADLRRFAAVWAWATLVVLAAAVGASADAFTDYSLVESFTLPAGAGEFDVLADGRMVTVARTDVYVESAPQSRTFGLSGSLARMDMSSFGAAFVKVSPDGTTLAVGNNGGSGGNYQVGVFDAATFTGEILSAVHFDAAWYADGQLAMTAGVGDFVSPSFVTVLDVLSADTSNPVNPTVVSNVGGASGGIAFDSAGNLYTGNGFQFTGPSTTGVLKAFSAADWVPALTGGAPVDFELDGTLIGDVLSAGSLGFDGDGNLHVGGGDFAEGETDYAGLVRAAAVAGALGGDGAVDISDPTSMRRLDPDVAGSNFYDVSFNAITGELYVREQGVVYVYAVPEPASLLTLACGGLTVLFRRGRKQVRRAEGVESC